MMAKMRRSFWISAAVLLTVSRIVCAKSNEPDNIVPQNVFDGMRESFRADKAAGIHLKYQWELSGPDGGDWFAEVDDGKCKIDKGRVEKPDVTIVSSDKDWVAISNSKLSGWWAYISGRLK